MAASVAAGAVTLDDEVLREVWVGTIAVAFVLHPADVGTLERPPPYFVRFSPTLYNIFLSISGDACASLCTFPRQSSSVETQSPFHLFLCAHSPLLSFCL